MRRTERFPARLVLKYKATQAIWGQSFCLGMMIMSFHRFALICVSEASGTFTEGKPSSCSLDFLVENGNRINSSLWRSADLLCFMVILMVTWGRMLCNSEKCEALPKSAGRFGGRLMSTGLMVSICGKISKMSSVKLAAHKWLCVRRQMKCSHLEHSRTRSASTERII